MVVFIGPRRDESFSSIYTLLDSHSLCESLAYSAYTVCSHTYFVLIDIAVASLYFIRTTPPPADRTSCTSSVSHVAALAAQSGWRRAITWRLDQRARKMSRRGHCTPTRSLSVTSVCYICLYIIVGIQCLGVISLGVTI